MATIPFGVLPERIVECGACETGRVRLLPIGYGENRERGVVHVPLGGVCDKCGAPATDFGNDHPSDIAPYDATETHAKYPALARVGRLLQEWQGNGSPLYWAQHPVLHKERHSVTDPIGAGILDHAVLFFAASYVQDALNINPTESSLGFSFDDDFWRDALAD